MMFIKLRKYIISVICVVLSISLVACSANGKNLTIETLMELSTKEDIIDYFGESTSSDTYDCYDVTFMNNSFSMLVDYNDDLIESVSMTYYFIGMQDIELAMDMISYEPSSEDISQAEKFVNELVETFSEKYGEPDIFDSPVSTTTYTWGVGDCEIEVQDNIDNEQLSLLGAIDVNIEY